MLWLHMIRTGALLAIFALIGTGLVAFTYNATKDKIAEAERLALLNKLHAVIKPEEHDNDMFHDTITVKSANLLGTEAPVAVFRARKQGQPIGVLLTPVAPDGYNGEINLLIGIYYDGSLAGVRVLSHKETPGLGDAIEEKRSDWVFGFNQQSLITTDKKGWRVKRDGGQFDQFTGATITPRAIVKAVHNSLLYYASNKDKLFEPIDNPEKDPKQQAAAKQNGK